MKEKIRTRRQAGMIPEEKEEKRTEGEAGAKGRQSTGREPSAKEKPGTGKEQGDKERPGKKKGPAVKVYKGVLQLLFPLRCPVCDGIVRPAGEKICLSCLGKLKLLTPPWCMKCGKKLGEEEEFCTDCRRKKHEFVRGRALYDYGSAALSIYRFKYGGRREYADFFGEQAAEYLGDFIRGVCPDALVPVPLHRKRKAARGFNQAELLAEAVGERLNIPVCTGYLVREKNTAPLKYENPEERQNNLKKAFNIAQNDVELKRIIIIDDIYTTGSTMDEISRVLKKAGAEAVYFVALACGSGI